MPGPPYLSVAQDSETSAVVRWDPPALLNGMDLQGYRLQFGRKDISPLATLEFDPQEHHYSVGSIHRGTTYLFKVSAKSRGGFGEEAAVELSVPENTPGGYPHIHAPSNVTCCSVQLSWAPPVLAERNGAITEYTLAYKEAGSGGPPRELRVAAGLSSFVLNSLKPDSAYDVKIRAHTSVGPGPYSPPMQYRSVAFEPTGRVSIANPNQGGVCSFCFVLPEEVLTSRRRYTEPATTTTTATKTGKKKPSLLLLLLLLPPFLLQPPSLLLH